MIRHELDNPFLETLGASLVEWSDGFAEIAMPIGDAHLNRQRVLQGGAVATLLDAACGYAGLYRGSGDVVHGFTLSLTINYLDRGLGKKLSANEFLERKGKSIYFCRGEAWVWVWVIFESLAVAG